jgi:hypothetical protein
MNTISNIGNINPKDYKSVNDKLTNNDYKTLKDLVKNSNDTVSVDTVSVDVKEKMDNKVGTKNEENSGSKKFIPEGITKGFVPGGWKGGLLRIASVANKVAPFTVRFAGAISFLGGLGAFFNLIDGIRDVFFENRYYRNIHYKIDGVIDLASVAAWVAGMAGGISAPVGLAIVGGLYGAKIINYAVARYNENKENKERKTK